MRQFLTGLAITALLSAGSVFAAEDVSGKAAPAEATENSAPRPLADHHKALVGEADAVALVQINHVNSLINQALSRPGLLSVEGFSYQVSIERQWKGDMNTGDELRIDLSSCTKTLQREERYVIMAQRSDQQWVSQSCEQVVSLVEGEALLAYLQDVFAPQLAQQ